jgi:hypothetical protein
LKRFASKRSSLTLLVTRKWPWVNGVKRIAWWILDGDAMVSDTEFKRAKLHEAVTS